MILANAPVAFFGGNSPKMPVRIVHVVTVIFAALGVGVLVWG